MNQKTFRISTMALAGAAWLAAPIARATLTVGAQAGAAYHAPNLSGPGSGALSSSAKPALVFGGYVGMSVLGIGTEAGLHFQERKYKLKPLPGTNAYNTTVIDFQLKLNVPYVAFGAGPFVGFVTGDYGPTRNGVDAGLLGSVRLGIPVLPTLSLTAEGRYLWGFADMRGGLLNEKTREWQAMLGVEFNIL